LTAELMGRVGSLKLMERNKKKKNTTEVEMKKK
jgi:hypothetical protein